MRLEFKVRGDKFDELVLLFKKISTFCDKSSVLCLLVERPSEEDPHGSMRIHIDKPNAILMMIDAKYFLETITFKCEQDLAIISFTNSELFFQFLTDARPKSQLLTFSLKRQENFKFMQVLQEDGDIKNVFRIPIEQKSILGIDFWDGVIEPTLKCPLDNKDLKQYLEWLNAFDNLYKFALKFSLRSSGNDATLKLSADLEKMGNIAFEGKVEIESEGGADVDESREIKKDQFQFLKNIVDTNKNVSLLMKGTKQFALEVSGNAFNIQAQLHSLKGVKMEG